MIKFIFVLLFIIFPVLISCKYEVDINDTSLGDGIREDTLVLFMPVFISDDNPVSEIPIVKALLYDQHTLPDTYTYRKGKREFQWEKMKGYLAELEEWHQRKPVWAILQNYRNRNGEAPLVVSFRRNEYKRVADTLGVERYQSVPLYIPGDTVTPVRYGRDGSLVMYLGYEGRYAKIATLNRDEIRQVPLKYVKVLPDTLVFNKIIFVDVTNQNATALEKAEKKWLVRSMNPVTTGKHGPPYMQETPLGIFVIQEHKPKMIYLKDGKDEHGGFAPFASRFTNGGYIHGIPVNEPHTDLIEFSPSLGTVPRSHMCVRSATSHARFIYDWAVPKATLVIVIK